MKRKALQLNLSLVFVLGCTSAFSAEQTWTGQISDAMCGADHSMMKHDGKTASSRDCTLECVKDGGKYVLVSKGKVYQIGNQDLKDLQQHAGHTVKLTGQLSADGKTITASNLQMPTAQEPASRKSSVGVGSKRTSTKAVDSSGTDSTQETHGGKTPPVPPE